MVRVGFFPPYIYVGKGGWLEEAFLKTHDRLVFMTTDEISMRDRFLSKAWNNLFAI